MLKNNKPLLYIIVAGAILRLFFVLIGASVYFGRANIFVDGDTSAWAYSFQNFLEHGIYTINPEKEMGAFNRLPGYSFFLGIFYLICGQDWSLTYKVVGWFQTLLDVSLIPVVYAISLTIFNQRRIAIISAALYALYPFVIVWTPVCYSEYLSVFIMFWALYFLTRNDIKYNYAITGLLTGIGALFRPQLILLTPAIGLYVLLLHRKSIGIALKHAIVMGLCFLMGYGLWPLRNYINYNKVVLVQDLSGADNWSPDVIAYMQYMFAVKTDWFPQFTQIIENDNYELTPYCYASAADSIKLMKAIDMAKNCSRGFSCWKGYWKELVPVESDCGPELEKYFTELRSNIIQKYPFRFYVTIPLNNLKKAIFKLKLNDTKTFARKAASALFAYRTLLILLGLLGCIFLVNSTMDKIKWFAFMVLLFFLIVYLFLCAGTGPQTRNIEIRYFLHSDLLLLFPVAYIIDRFAYKRKSESGG
jgi:hypothetical protein